MQRCTVANQAPSVVVDNWASATKAAAPKYVAGVRATTKNPGELAAQAADKYQTGVMEAVSSGRYAEGCRSVSPQQWKDACEKTGSQRISSGVDKGKPKMQVFMAEFLPAQAAITDQVRQMPSGDLEQRIARMTAQVRATAALKGRFRR